MRRESDLSWKTFLEMISSLSAQFVATPHHKVDKVIQQALDRVGRYFNADRSYIFLFSDDARLCSNTHEWCADGVTEQIEGLQNLEADIFPNWLRSFNDAKPVHIPQVNDIPSDSVEYGILAHQSVQSALMVPMNTKDGLFGMFGLDLVRTHKSWSDDEIAAIRLLAGNICSLLQRQRAEQKIDRLAFFDTLTGLANRSLIRERIRQSLRSSQRSSLYNALIIIDLDRFKSLNEEYGHHCGDELLSQMAERLRRFIPESDSLARLGDDEFAVLVDSVSSELTDTLTRVKKLCETLNEVCTEPYELDDQRVHVSISFGISIFDGDITDVEVPLRQSDIAIRRAKASGGNTIRFYDNHLEVLSVQRTSLLHDMRQALLNDQFELHYQVLVDANQKPVACEALVRWNHPERGLLLPGVFIPFAEESGLIVRLGRKILSLACEQLQIWQDDPVLGQLPMSVNISMKQFRDPGFASFVASLVDFQPQLCRQLKLEITESLLAVNLDDVITTMDKLVALGLTFSLDDFGTGYSSLSYLRSLPLSQLKIDRSFVREVADQAQSRAIAQTILTLGTNLGLDVVAEGVETPEQREELVSMGCRIFQGYLFAKSLPAAEFEALVRSDNITG